VIRDKIFIQSFSRTLEKLVPNRIGEKETANQTVELISNKNKKLKI